MVGAQRQAKIFKLQPFLSLFIFAYVCICLITGAITHSGSLHFNF